MAKSMKLAELCKFHLLWIPLFLPHGTAKVADSTDIWIAKGITQKCLPYTTKISVSERNVLVCGFHAKAHGASLFGYDNKSCVIYKEAESTHNSTMVFQMVESVGHLEEIATNKPAASIGYSFGSTDPRAAVDRNVTTYFILSASYTNNYWIVDFGEVINIHKVKIQRFNVNTDLFEIRVGMEYRLDGNFTRFTLFATSYGNYSLTDGALYCHSFGVQGRFLSIQRISAPTTYWYIKEVFVYAEIIG
ncbi:uncharacterized protein [Palaemon carinicauda]|uniref:uncharacterized protein n=1 Tax=Palaemon carinicauda TaxID=392227 RepID=UPI0035B5EC09